MDRIDPHDHPRRDGPAARVATTARCPAARRPALRPLALPGPGRAWPERQDLVGYKVEATDGRNRQDGRAPATSAAGGSYLVVDTGPWIFGKKVMLPAGTVNQVDHDAAHRLRRPDPGPDQGSPRSTTRPATATRATGISWGATTTRRTARSRPARHGDGSTRRPVGHGPPAVTVRAWTPSTTADRSRSPPPSTSATSAATSATTADPYAVVGSTAPTRCTGSTEQRPGRVRRARHPHGHRPAPPDRGRAARPGAGVRGLAYRHVHPEHADWAERRTRRAPSLARYSRTGTRTWPRPAPPGWPTRSA